VISYLHHRQAAGEIVTGLLFVDPDAEDLHGYLKTASKPFNEMTEDELCPGSAALDKLNAGLR
jgi:2-oxoglutarate ferredoxin oxidoreductase subunit beta